jgi:hypothetical protein
VQQAQGDLKAALKSYSDSLAIRDRLAQSDPGNGSQSWARIGPIWGMPVKNLPLLSASFQSHFRPFEYPNLALDAKLA